MVPYSYTINYYITHNLGPEGKKQKALAKELHQAAQDNDVNKVRTLLDTNSNNLEFVNMRVPDSDGTLNTALDGASFLGFVDIVKLLVRKGRADPDIKDSQNFTATFGAAQEDNFEVVKVLVEEADSNINEPNGPLGNTVFMIAVLRNNARIVNYLIPKVSDINMKNYGGYTPLFMATENANLRVVKDLVYKGKADVDAKSGVEGYTATMFAAQEGAIKKFKFLVGEGEADLTITSDDEFGQNALHIATLRGRTEIVRYLTTQARVNFDTKDKKGYTSLFAAAENGYLEIVKILVEQTNADVNSKNGLEYESTPLMIASAHGHVDTVRYLLNHGAKLQVNHLNLKVYSALSAAVEEGHAEVAKILVEEGDANVELRHEDHLWTVLHRAAYEGYLDIVKYLVEKAGANISARTGDGRDTAQTLAEKNGHPDVAQYLKSVGRQRFT